MIVSMPRRRGRSMGDTIDDNIGGDDVQFSDRDTLAPTPSWATSASSAGPVAPAASTNSDTGWTGVASQLLTGVVRGLLPGSSAPKPTNVLAAPSSSSISPVVIVGGVAAVGLVAFLLLRRRAA